MQQNAHTMAMNKPRLHAATLGGSPDEIEAAFYEALQAADIDRLMACWADEDEVVCIHPGGPRVVGATAIRTSFESIFSQGAIPAKPEHVRRVEALASAVHHVLEKVEVHSPTGPLLAYVVATNVYHKTAQGWRMVVHHASPGIPGEVPEYSPPSGTLH